MMTQTGEATGDLAPSRFCRACGADAPLGTFFCGECGAALTEATESDATVVVRRRIGGTHWAPAEAAASPRPETVESTAGLHAAPLNSTQNRMRKKRRRKPRWYRRPLVMAPLALVVVIAGLAGTLAYRAQSTFDTIQQVSTLPPQVTDSTVGDENLPADIVFDTEPARVAMVEAGVMPEASDGGVFGGFKDAAGDVGDLASGAAIAAGVKDPSKDAITILVMGVDARPGAPIDIGVRPDAMMVLYLNPVTGACRGLAIPRDTLVNLPGYGETKVNHALMLAGIPYQQLVLEQFLALEIDHYALIDFVGFKELVDAVGGVTINVPSEIKEGESVLFTAGAQTFDGDQALSYARYRGGADVDAGRVRRQQQIIRGLIQTGAGRNIASDVNKLLPAVSNHVRTDLSSAELISFAEQYRTQCSESKLELDTLQGDIVTPDTPDPVYQMPLAYSKVDEAVVREKVANLTR
jgi:LCP family protein required for cell wall assembly